MTFNKQLLQNIINISFKLFILKKSLLLVAILIIATAYTYGLDLSDIPVEDLPENAINCEYEIDMPINKVCENMEKIAESKPYLVTYENKAEKVIETHDILLSKSEDNARCGIYIKSIDNYIDFELKKFNDKTLVKMNRKQYNGLFDIFSSQYFIVTEILSEIGSWHFCFMNLITFSVYLFLIMSHIIVPIFILLVIEAIIIVVCGGILVYQKIRNNKRQSINSILEK